MTEYKQLQKLLTDANVDNNRKREVIKALCRYRLQTEMSNKAFKKKFSAEITHINLSSGATIQAQDVVWLGDAMTYTYRYASLLLNQEVSFSTEFCPFSQYVPSVYEVDLDEALLGYLELVYNAPTQSDPNAAQADGVRARQWQNLLSE
jgi:hypothetical protein